MKAWFKESWHVIVGWLVMLGVIYGIHTVEMRWIDARLQKLEDLNLPQMKWQVEKNTGDISAIVQDNKAREQQINSINVQIGQINTKLDNIVDILRKDKKP